MRSSIAFALLGASAVVAQQTAEDLLSSVIPACMRDCTINVFEESSGCSADDTACVCGSDGSGFNMSALADGMTDCVMEADCSDEELMSMANIDLDQYEAQANSLCSGSGSSGDDESTDDSSDDTADDTTDNTDETTDDSSDDAADDTTGDSTDESTDDSSDNTDDAADDTTGDSTDESTDDSSDNTDDAATGSNDESTDDSSDNTNDNTNNTNDNTNNSSDDSTDETANDSTDDAGEDNVNEDTPGDAAITLSATNAVLAAGALMLVAAF
ncbi:hypothetical protein BJX70DRAFT_403497 [Aspergillus crustosus]